jgi:hypothetical protein
MGEAAEPRGFRRRVLAQSARLELATSDGPLRDAAIAEEVRVLE